MENQAANVNMLSQRPATTSRPQNTTVDLVELFYLLWGHMLQIIICLVVGGVAAFAYTYFLVTPQYQATTKMYIVSASNNSVVNLTDLQIGSQLTADYQELMYNRPMLEDVIESLALEMTYKDLAKRISISNPNATRILCITVTDPDPQRAANIANEMAKQAIIYLPRIMECETPNISEEAICPTQKSSPSYSRNTLLGAMLAVVIYCGVLVLRYLMNDSFVTPEDISQYFGVQPLATIPEGEFGDGSKKKHGYSYRKKEKNALSNKTLNEKTEKRA